MFSGLRSLCMILFSWRYWIPDPAVIKQRFLLKDTTYLNQEVGKGATNSDRTYRRRWATTGLHSPSDHSSFRVCLVTATITKHMSRNCTLLSGHKQRKMNFMKVLTFLRSPLEQYSMARSGRSFKAISFISSGTSLAVTTLMWFSLGQRRIYCWVTMSWQLQRFCKVTSS